MAPEAETKASHYILGNFCMKEKIVEKIILNVIFAKMEIQVWKDAKQRNSNGNQGDVYMGPKKIMRYEK